MQTDRDSNLRMVGSSAATRALDEEITAAARSDAKVLITGETGVGKDLVARLLHARGARRLAAMAAINCAGLPDTLLESELFGHVRGSFTGAYRDKPGLFESARHGTVFLDEVGDMSPRMQGVLLRFLETGELQRIGAVRPQSAVDVRVIAATNRDLGAQVDARTFRSDLYYRLSAIQMEVAPLRERRADVPDLLDHFLARYARHHGVPARSLAPEALDALTAYRWPGNVRELKNVAERAVLRAGGVRIELGDLPAELKLSEPAARTSAPGAAADASFSTVSDLVDRIVMRGESFWGVVYGPFMSRDLSREQLRAIVRAGLEQTAGNYRVLVRIFNMVPEDYKRFMGFLAKHDCRVPFHPFRVPPVRQPLPDAAGRRIAEPYAHAAGA